MSQTLKNNDFDTSSFSAVITVLDIVAFQLNDIAKDVETSVLGVCNGFQGMSTRARSALSNAAEALDTSSEDGGLPAFVHRVRMALATIVAKLESSREYSNQLGEQISEIDQRLDLVVKLGEKMIDFADEARNATSCSFAVLKLSIGNHAEAERLLESFKVLSQASAKCGQAICSLVVGLRRNSKDGIARARVKAEEDQAAIEASEATIRATLDSMSTAYEQMNESLANSAAINRQLNLDIGQAVMSMQFQDRVSQRIDHIVSTLQELISDIRPLAQSANAETADMVTRLWTQRLAEKATMEAERQASGASQQESNESTIDLF